MGVLSLSVSFLWAAETIDSQDFEKWEGLPAESSFVEGCFMFPKAMSTGQ